LKGSAEARERKGLNKGATKCINKKERKTKKQNKAKKKTALCHADSSIVIEDDQQIKRALTRSSMPHFFLGRCDELNRTKRV